jgi:hypothetical protein
MSTISEHCAPVHKLWLPTVFFKFFQHEVNAAIAVKTGDVAAVSRPRVEKVSQKHSIAQEIKTRGTRIRTPVGSAL